MEPCCRIGSVPRSLKRSRCTIVHGKDAEKCGWRVWNKRRATDSTAEQGLLQLLELLEQADGVERVCHLEQFLLHLGR